MTESTLTGRALWNASPRGLSYDVLVQDREAFCCAISDNLATHEFTLLTGNAFGGKERKEYDRRHKELCAYLDTHEIDPQLRDLIREMEDTVYDFASEAWDQGMQFAIVVEQFRQGLQALTATKEGEGQ